MSFIYFQPNFGLYGLFRNFFGPYQILALNYKFLSCTFDFLISILVVFKYTILMIQNVIHLCSSSDDMSVIFRYSFYISFFISKSE